MGRRRRLAWLTPRLGIRRANNIQSWRSPARCPAIWLTAPPVALTLRSCPLRGYRFVQGAPPPARRACSFGAMKKLLALASGSLLALSAGAGIASASVSAAELQEMISSQIASEAGAVPDAVVCPGDLASAPGASVTCSVTAGGETRGVVITVESVDNGQLGLSMKLAQQ
ncbi:MAG: DUF4333 domain-containing protein [Mycobacterium sp.]|nr:DUF4333 domain-containing protein [Mycobacterium sp.]